MSVCIIIPARIHSRRLPNKPLVEISGKTMIERVYESCLKSGVTKDIFVATDSEEIKNIIEKIGGKAIITDPELASGTDRIYQAYKIANLNHKYIINVQGDVPNISSEIIKKTYTGILNSNFDITTPVVKVFQNNENLQKTQFVKAVLSVKDNQSVHNALYFTRNTCPFDSKEFFFHIGLYVYTKDSLEKFVLMKPSYLEKIEQLEQLRALENGMKIGAIEVEDSPISIDTYEDLEEARRLIKS